MTKFKQQLKVLSAKRPRFRDYRGRTWDTLKITLPNGKQIKGHLDTTWGQYAYFQYNGKWKKISLDACTDSRSNDIDLRGIWKPREWKGKTK